MIVEFISTPGAGKTTLLPTGVEYFRERGLPAFSVLEAARPYAQRTLLGDAIGRFAPAALRRPLLWQVFYYHSLLYQRKFIRKNPELIQQVLRFQERRPISAEAHRHVLHWFFRLLGDYEFLTAYAWPDEVLVFDEGFIHRVVQMNASPVEQPDPAQVLAYVNLLPRPDLVIVPQAPPEVCEQRIYRRGVWKHFRQHSPAELSRYVANAHRVVNWAVDHIKNQGWTVIEVDNEGDDLARSKAELRNQLTQALALARQADGPKATLGTGITSRPSVQPIFHLPRPSRLSQSIHARLRPLDIDSDAVCEVLHQYGLELTRPSRNLPFGRRGRNVEVDTSAGKKALKLYRPSWQAATVTYEHSILIRLAQRGFPALRLATTPSGETFVSRDGRCYALFDFVEGTNYATNFFLRAHRLRLMTLAGRTLARLHRQLEGFVPEGRHHLGFETYTGERRRDLAWHATTLNNLKAKSRDLARADEKAHADWLIQHSNYVLDELGPLDQELRVAPLLRLIIHGDYGLHNLIFQPDGTITPVDFELSRLEWRLSDLVSCLSRFRHGNVDYDFESMRCFMEGYQAEHLLSPDEWRLLPQVWRFYKLQGAVQYWNSYFETAGPASKLLLARDAIGQADWVLHHPDQLLVIKPRLAFTPDAHEWHESNPVMGDPPA